MQVEQHPNRPPSPFLVCNGQTAPKSSREREYSVKIGREKALEGLRILIVEDELLVAMHLEEMAEELGCKIAAIAPNGRAAVRLGTELKPDVVLMDIRMPVLTGVEAIAKIRSESPHAHIIALSTYGGDQDVRRALEAGAQAYLTKEVLHDELLKAIWAVHAGRSYLPVDVAATVAAQWPSPDLSSRETEVLTHIVKGMSNKQIAATLNIAEHTVKNHVKSILSKLGVEDRTQAATSALQRGIVHLP